MSEEAPQGRVTMRTEGRIAVIQVENEAKMNSYSPEMLEELSAHLTAFDATDDLWVAVFCSAGDHTTAGLDMPKFFGPTATAKTLPADQVDPFALGRRLSKPVIAVVQGRTYTVGIELMLAADVVVAADSCRFQQLESKRGIAPLGGAHFRYLSRTGWGNAMYHLFLCDEFDAQEAYRLGFVQEVVPHGQQLDRALELAAAMCTNAPLGLRATKAAALTYLEAGEKAAVEQIDTIKGEVFASEDCIEGIASFVERREAKFRGR